MNSTHLPSLFISHGSPMLALEDALTSQFLRRLSTRISKPRAIVIASAHWETDDPMLTGASLPETIHDFYGFPKALYALHYPVPGNPALANQVRSLLVTHGFKAEIDPSRGLDHGVWNPLLLMYPNADVPVIELSVQPHKDAQWHYRIGQALASLKKEHILIIGTGNLTHNLKEAFHGHHLHTPEWVNHFSAWVEECVLKDDIESLLKWHILAPYANENHPTPEHFLPFFVALGAAGIPLQAQHLHKDVALGVLAMDAYAFGAF
ncbi:MAG: dioxygenase [Alphaproteobacteria bacterium]|nr:dioxygenase [Alphaproteobacteria bacterium]